MFRSYLKLRLISAFRLLKELGILRSLFLLFFLALAFLILINAEERWILPSCYGLLLFFYHKNRKDRSFLQIQIRDITGFLRKEYILLTTPFLLIEIGKGNGWEIAGLICFSLLLPTFKEIKWEQKPLRLSFVYAGSMEYLRMLRQSGWIYPFLLFSAVMGAIHENLRVTKVYLLIWGFIQAGAYLTIPNPLYILQFKDFRTFQNHLWKSNSRNILLTSLPLFTILLVLAPDLNNLSFMIIFYFASLFYLQGIGLLREICRSSIGLFLIQLILFVPLYILSCLMPYLLLGMGTIIGIISYIVSKQLRPIWK